MPAVGAFRLKLNRADYHLALLSEEINGFLASNRLSIPGNYDQGTNQYVFYSPAVQFPSLDPSVSAVLGDVVHNLSATQRYLTYQLFKAVPSNGEKAGRHLYFPICTEEDVFDQDSPKKLKGIRNEARAAIKNLQPFRRSGDYSEPLNHPLALPHRLETWDKHRTLNTTFELGTFGFVGLPPEVQTETFQFTPEPGHAVYARLPVRPFIP
jgi:hypothetical protein